MKNRGVTSAANRAATSAANPGRASAPSHRVEGAFLGPSGRVRFAVTDRHGVRATPTLPVRGDAAAAALGASAGAYSAFDLAQHVGDDPAAVERNRGGLADALGLRPGSLAFMDQVHGADVAVVDAPVLLPVADALVTSTPGLALAVLVADCVPVVLADEDAGVAAVVHAGRRGVQLGVVRAAVERMTAVGADAARTWAVIGPAVCPAHYEVPAAMRDEVVAVVPEARGTSGSGTPALDLRAAVSAQLAHAGVGSIDAVGRCTVEDDTLFSYRRDGTTGRFAMLAWITP